MLENKTRRLSGSGSRAALRLATSEMHQRMHGLQPFAQIAVGALAIERYRDLLEALFVFHSAVGQAARNSGWSHLSS